MDHMQPPPTHGMQDPGQQQQVGSGFGPPRVPGQPVPPMEAMKHSGVGIASFIMSILLGIFMFLLIAIAGLMAAEAGGAMDEESMGAVILGLFLLAALGLEVVAIILGIVGMFQKQRKKVFAILGIVFSGLTLVGVVFLIIVGLAMGA